MLRRFSAFPMQGLKAQEVKREVVLPRKLMRNVLRKEEEQKQIFHGLTTYHDRVTWTN
jgi:hypothetical protein